MTLKVKYFAFLLFLHVLLTVLTYLLLQDSPGLFMIAELGILISLILSYFLYRAFMRPLEFIYTGEDAIADQDFTVKFLLTSSPEMNKLIKVYNQMIDSIRNERIQVEEQHFFLQKLIQASPAGIIILDYDGLITEINPKALQILGLQKSVNGRELASLTHPLAEQLSCLPEGESQIIAGRGLERYKCEAAFFVHRGFKRRFLIMQELSKEILAAEKRAYGKVIRMMAHEVNNSIGAINSILESTVEVFPMSDDEEERFTREALQVAIERNHRLNQFMKNFAEVVRLPAPKTEWIPVDQLIRNVARLMEARAKKQQITFEFKLLEAHDTRILIDLKQMEQALVNIVQNAMDSIQEQGIIRFAVQRHPTQLIIADNGPGIPSELAEKLFTPFFSTKPQGQGIGLTLVREIVLNHQAAISLQTEADGWTCCRITF